MAGDTAFLNASADGGATNLEGAFYAIHNGATSADQVSNERVAPVYGAPAGGVASLTNAPLAFTGTGSQTVSHLGVWDALTAGNFRFAVPLTGDLAFNAAGDLNLTAADVAAT